MNNKKIKSLLIPNCYIVVNQFSIYDLYIPKNAIIYNNKREKTMYICTHFPTKYNGKAENVRLNVSWYDYETRNIGTITIKNHISTALYESWINASRPHTHKIHHEMTDKDYEKLMYQPTKKKKQTGGVRLSKNSDIFTDGIKYKQNSVYAYYENLDNFKSGNASMIALRV